MVQSQAIAQLGAEIEKALLNFQFPNNPKSLYDPLHYILSLGGKRIRPILTLAAAQMFSDNYKAAMPQAIAIEMFHNFSLIHDDIMDKAPLRRGQTTVHKKWNTNTAILSGDLLLIKAYEQLAQCKPNYLPEILHVFNKTATQVCEGQQFDMDFETAQTVTVNNYLEMIRLKTSVLLGCSLQIGAIIGTANQNDAQNCYTFGENLGIAFQLMDDYLDAFGNPEKFGKQVGGDILANKKTFLLISAMADANNKQKEVLTYWIKHQKPNANQKVKEVKQVFDELNIAQKTKLKMQEFHHKAMKALQEINLPEEKKSTLFAFSQMLAIREV